MRRSFTSICASTYYVTTVISITYSFINTPVILGEVPSCTVGENTSFTFFPCRSPSKPLTCTTGRMMATSVCPSSFDQLRQQSEYSPLALIAALASTSSSNFADQNQRPKLSAKASFSKHCAKVTELELRLLSGCRLTKSEWPGVVMIRS
nr:hypothetical protein Iba_scaffold23831CG0040 [Ipomoea batatas]